MYINNVFLRASLKKRSSRFARFKTEIVKDRYKCGRRAIPSTVDYVYRSYTTQVPHNRVDVSEQRILMDSIANKLNIQNMDSWYNVSQKDILECGGRTILDKYQWSSPLLFSTIYPEHEWFPWKFSGCPPSFWNSLDNQQKFMEWASIQFNIKDMNDWYRVTAKDFSDIGGRGMLHKYNHSMYNLLTKIYPKYEWIAWKFSVCPPSYWDDVNNQQKFMEYAIRELNIKEMSDWYKVTIKKWNELGGSSLLNNKFKDSLFLLLNHFYPQYEWLPWRFEICPRSYWDNVNNQKKFMEWAEKELNIKHPSDWHKITRKTLYDLGGAGLLAKYRDSPALLISSFHPEQESLPWLHNKCPKNYWDDIENQRKFIKWASEKLQIKTMNDWYRISAKDICNIGGWGLLSKHHHSPLRLLSTVYPDYEWLPWKFANSPRNMWSNEEIKRKFIEWAGKELGVKELSDWNRVTLKEIVDLGGLRLLTSTSNSLPQLLSSIYPNFPWEFDSRSKSPFHKKSQHLLKALVKQLFPKNDILEEYKHPNAIGSSGNRLELDLFYPDLNIAFEYQGRQHYGKVEFFHNYATSLEEAQHRDLTKTAICKELGITLIEIPFWWDRKLESLAATVYEYRPDLFSEKPQGIPIPTEEPVLQKQAKSENITKKVLMTATEWDNNTMNPKGWYITEKYDGVRLYWNGKDMYTRHGTKVNAPDFIKLALPSITLDGELWTQYGLYQEAVSLCGKAGNDEGKWKKAVFWVFDTPDKANLPFEQRIEYLRELKDNKILPDFVKIVDLVKCTDNSHLKAYFDNIVAKGGEGVILREPQSLYKAGRSDSLKKFKPYFDTEVKVIENNYPHGLQCQQINGRHIFVSVTENFEEAKKVKIGALITVKYLGTNIHGTLQYPKFYRERTDVKWEDLIKT